MLQETARIFKALSEETRLAMLMFLMNGECSVGDVMRALHISQTSASRNLTVLRDAGFLNLRREGSCTRYSIATEPSKEYIADLVSIVQKALAGYKVTGKAREEGTGKGRNLGW